MNVTSDNCMAAKNMELPNSKKGNRRGITRNTTMKILVINGSPKGERSDTMHMTRAFLEGICGVAEHEVEHVDIMKQHIEFCCGCFSCKKNGGECIHNDDMAGLLQKYLDADVAIFSFPLYCYGMPAPLKAFFDRTMPLSTMAMRKVGDRYEHTGPVDFSRIHTVVISGCGFPSVTNNYEPLRREFELMIPHDLFMLTVPEAPMFNVPEAAEVTVPFLELVREAGRHYAESYSVPDELMEKLAIPMIPEEMYTAIANGEMI